MVQHFDCNLKVIEQKPLFGRQQHSLWTTLSKVWPSLRIKAVILKTFFWDGRKNTNPISSFVLFNWPLIEQCHYLVAAERG